MILRIDPQNPRVLVLDADPLVRALFRRTLEEADFVVMEAGDTTEAQRQVVCANPDVVVLDLAVPECRAIDLIRRWRSAQKNLGMLVLTRSGSLDQEVASLEAGADDYLCKPVPPRVLVARVHNVLSRTRGTPGSGSQWPAKAD